MKNEPKRWECQTWTIPGNTLRLERKSEVWSITDCYGVVIAVITKGHAELLATYLSSVHAEEDWIDRHSWQFRWLRFWYRRKKRREARKLLSQPSTVKE